MVFTQMSGEDQMTITCGELHTGMVPAFRGDPFYHLYILRHSHDLIAVTNWQKFILGINIVSKNSLFCALGTTRGTYAFHYITLHVS